MCCFSRPVISVSGTNIYAREMRGGRQALAYSMKLAAGEDLAMILPIPVAPGSGEDAVEFIDLSGYPAFFDDMAVGFAEIPRGLGLRSRGPSPANLLAVFKVGSFEASFVPTVGDFDRLDPRFRLPTEVWAKLPDYAAFGFAVFKLKKGEKKIHPMAFEFPRADPDKLFFPTVHIHDGEVHPVATFDHALFCQWSDRAQKRSGVPGEDWFSSRSIAGEFVKAGKTKGLVDPGELIFRRRIQGPEYNKDVYVAA